jgi:DNA-binding response OmpR family regulator
MNSPLRVIAAAEGMEIWLPEGTDHTPEGTLSHPVSTGTRRARILVVDDEIHLIRFVHAVLDRDGYEVLSALNGQEALEVVERERPDLILLDVMMPKMNGYQVVEKLKASPELQDIPIIMFTARETEEDIMQSFQMGVIDYIHKPVASSVLRSRIRRWLLSPEQPEQEEQSTEDS